jgi:hypothetical protein
MPEHATPEQRAAFMAKQDKAGPAFMPRGNGRCWNCRGDVVEAEIAHGNDGSILVTGCRLCNHSYCE